MNDKVTDSIALGPVQTPESAAALLRCSPKTIEERLRAGDLPGEKFGEGWILPTEALLRRVNEIAIERMAERRKQPEKASLQLVGKPARRAPPALQ
jgi:excisionase family DNA binding protein